MDSPSPYTPPATDATLPEHAVDPSLADRWARLGGAFVDGILTSLVAIGPNLVFFGTWKPTVETDPESPGLSIAVRFAAVIFYTVLNAGLLHTRGQTVGKIAAGTRIVRRDGLPVTFWYLLGKRYLSVWVFGAVASFDGRYLGPFGFLSSVGGMIFLLNFLLIFRRSRACLHDDWAKTKVIWADYDPPKLPSRP